MSIDLFAAARAAHPRNDNRFRHAFDSDLHVVTAVSDAEPIAFAETIDSALVQFIYCLSGTVTLSFSGGRYQRAIQPDTCTLLYDPHRPVAIEWQLGPDSKMAAVFLPLSVLHRLVLGTNVLPFLSGEASEKAYRAERPIHVALSIVIDAMFDASGPVTAHDLLLLAKGYESVFEFVRSPAEEDMYAACPFLRDEANVARIRHAKDVVLQRMGEPPSIPELARIVGMNEAQLKAGFKRIYGAPIYAFLTDHRMARAMHMLQTGGLKVNEVAYAVGYANASHFIAAFKKRFGVTPKQLVKPILHDTSL